MSAISGDGIAVAPHIRFCPIDEQVIVLDLLNNRYAGIAGAPFAALASALDWSPRGQLRMFDTHDSELASLTEPLRARGWLVQASSPSPPLSIDAELPEATQTLVPQASNHHAAGGPIRFLRCLRSAVAASSSLRHRSLFAIAKAIGERKKALPRRRDDAARDELIDAVSAYRRLRPLLFSARDRCLHDSLTLVRFLAAERIASTWVIGVRIRPFAAHSWVQHEGLVLNDQHERVRAYRPIFAA